MNNILDAQYFVIRGNTPTLVKALDLDPNKAYTHIAITSCSIPKTFYVLNRDATLIVNEGGSLRTVVVPKGNYNVQNFKTLMAGYINAVSTFVYAISYPPINSVDDSKYTYSVSGNGGVQPTFFTNDKYLAQVMGIRVGVVESFVANILQSYYVLNFTSFDEILITSNMVENKLSLLQEIYTTANPYNSSIAWLNPSIELNAKRLNTNRTNSYVFNLLDMDGNGIELNGSEWSLVIMVFKVDNMSLLIKKMIELVALKESLNLVD